MWHTTLYVTHGPLIEEGEGQRVGEDAGRSTAIEAKLDLLVVPWILFKSLVRVQ